MFKNFLKEFEPELKKVDMDNVKRNWINIIDSFGYDSFTLPEIVRKKHQFANNNNLSDDEKWFYTNPRFTRYMIAILKFEKYIHTLHNKTTYIKDVQKINDALYTDGAIKFTPYYSVEESCDEDYDWNNNVIRKCEVAYTAITDLLTTMFPDRFIAEAEFDESTYALHDALHQISVRMLSCYDRVKCGDADALKLLDGRLLELDSRVGSTTDDDEKAWLEEERKDIQQRQLNWCD